MKVRADAIVPRIPFLIDKTTPAKVAINVMHAITIPTSAEGEIVVFKSVEALFLFEESDIEFMR